MLKTVENVPKRCIIKSSNCSSQYKSSQHFDNIQNICNKIGVSTIFQFSVARHGKWEVDHASGLEKCFAHCYVGTGDEGLNATDGKDFLGTKFPEKQNPVFFLKLIDVDDLADSRADARLKKTLMIEGSDSFQVMVF